MNQTQFLNEIKKNMPHSMKAAEKEEVLAFYEEMIQDRLEAGECEDTILSSLSTPDEIAAENGWSKTSWRQISTPLFILLILAAILGFPLWGSLLLTILLFLLCVYILLWCGPVMSLMMTGALIIGGLYTMIVSFFAIADGLGIAVSQFGIGMMFLGVGLFLAIPTLFICKKITQITLQLTKKWFLFLPNGGKSA